MNTNQTPQNGNNESGNDSNTPQKKDDAFETHKPNNPEIPAKEDPKHSVGSTIGR